MVAAQIIALIAAGVLVLIIHRAGISTSLRAVGSVCWALSAAWDRGTAEYRDCYAACMERAR